MFAPILPITTVWPRPPSRHRRLGGTRLWHAILVKVVLLATVLVETVLVDTVLVTAVTRLGGTVRLPVSCSTIVPTHQLYRSPQWRLNGDDRRCIPTDEHTQTNTHKCNAVCVSAVCVKKERMYRREEPSISIQT